MAQLGIGWLTLSGSARSIAFIESLSRAEPSKVLEMARVARVGELHASAKTALDATVVASGRTAEAWYVRDAVQTALHSLLSHAPPTRAGARIASRACSLAYDAALALLVEDVLPANHVAALCEPFATLL